ncbi:hypothetical protein [Nocardia salmonicida]|uniref:hypothetical protein n=1 Tax=Nocardia salmonicida TaxID=53431 RepID=UPI00379EFDD5
MSAPTSERRLLRPRYILFAAGRLWVIDETQPVAVLLEPNSGQIDRIVSWPEIPFTSPHFDGCLPGDSVWAQYRGTDILACVTVDGVHHAEYLEGTHLLTAGSSGAWCFRPVRVRDDVARTADEPPLHIWLALVALALDLTAWLQTIGLGVLPARRWDPNHFGCNCFPYRAGWHTTLADLIYASAPHTPQTGLLTTALGRLKPD